MNIESQVVHAGDRKRRCPNQAIPSTTPITLSSTYFYESAESLDRALGLEGGFSYARYSSPTNEALEELLTTLEGGAGSLVTSSGMSALQIAFQAALLDRPKTLLSSDSIYGATVGLLDSTLAPFGIDVRYADACNLQVFETAINKYKPGCIFVETISNPLLRVCDIEHLAQLARSCGAAFIVDSTFATPVLVQPLRLGANVVVHSLTKYLAGHGDVLGGAAILDQTLLEPVRAVSRLTGPQLGPFESYLTMRGIKTLALRYERHCANAARVAEWLNNDSRIERVFYCGRPDHPDAAIIDRTFAPGLRGGIVSFEIKDAHKEDVLQMLDRLRMIVPGTSLGDVHSLVLYPFIASHRNVSPKMRERMGIRENLVRIAVGIENIEDIQTDLDRALSA